MGIRRNLLVRSPACRIPQLLAKICMGMDPPARYQRLPANARQQNIGQSRFKQELVLGQHSFQSRPHRLRPGENYKKNLEQTQITQPTKSRIPACLRQGSRRLSLFLNHSTFLARYWIFLAVIPSRQGPRNQFANSLINYSSLHFDIRHSLLDIGYSSIKRSNLHF